MKLEGYENRTLLTKEEVAGILVISLRKVNYMIEDGTLPIVRLGGKTVRIRVSDVIALINHENKKRASRANTCKILSRC